MTMTEALREIGSLRERVIDLTEENEAMSDALHKMANECTCLIAEERMKHSEELEKINV